MMNDARPQGLSRVLLALRVCRSDFLLVRDGAGRLSLRELTGTVVMGQEEPRIRVPYPRTKEKRCVNFCWNMIMRSTEALSSGDVGRPNVHFFSSFMIANERPNTLQRL